MSISRICHKRFNRLGFSLVELLLVLTLAPVIFFAVYSNFSTGVRLWKRIQVPIPQEDVLIFYEKSVKDIQNTMRSKQISYFGEKDRISFCTGVEADKTLGGARGIGQITYYYDDFKKILFREVKDYSQLYRDAAGSVAPLLRDISSVEFSFFALNLSSHEYEWKDDFSGKGGNVPTAVRIRYVAKDSPKPVTETFFIPTGWAAKDKGASAS